MPRPRLLPRPAGAESACACAMPGWVLAAFLAVLLPLQSQAWPKCAGQAHACTACLPASINLAPQVAAAVWLWLESSCGAKLVQECSYLRIWQWERRVGYVCWVYAGARCVVFMASGVLESVLGKSYCMLQHKGIAHYWAICWPLKAEKAKAFPEANCPARFPRRVSWPVACGPVLVPAMQKRYLYAYGVHASVFPRSCKRCLLRSYLLGKWLDILKRSTPMLQSQRFAASAWQAILPRLMVSSASEQARACAAYLRRASYSPLPQRWLYQK